MTQRGESRAGLGAASMVLILLVLCLALLGVLSLISARNDLQLSLRHQQLAVAYADAAAQAQRVLAALDAQLDAAWLKSESETQYAAACMEIAQAGGTMIEWQDDVRAGFALDAGFERQLVVEFDRSLWENAAENRFTIVRHTLMDTKEWEQTESLILMGI